MRPEVVEGRSGLHAATGPGPVVLVPTMGALHAGHAALVRAARERAGAEGTVVVSVFVNPLQFAPGEDLERYPRSIEADLATAEAAGADLVFAPHEEEVYPGGVPLVTVDPGPLASELEGAVRPSHFRGVLTVVAKLFGLVGPDVAVFGEKDYQQLVLVRRMTADLSMPVEVVGVETVREADGLALSSRNAYLAPSQRAAAVALSRALAAAEVAARDGAEAAERAGRAVLEGEADAQVELGYLTVRDPELGPAPLLGEGRVLVAGTVGSTRLIDNRRVRLG